MYPQKWPFCGYNQIQNPPGSYRILDLDSLVRLMGFANLNDFQLAHKKWIEASLSTAGASERKSDWSHSIAVGSQSFIEKVKKNLGFKAKGKSITGSNEHYQLRENVTKFGNSPSGGLYTVEGPDSGFTNTSLWDEKS